MSPYLAFTWCATGKWEVSGRAIYDWSSRNDRPPSALDVCATQAGQQFAMDLSASYAVSEHVRLGLAGYALQQVSDARAGGRSLAGSRQRAFAAGPGFRYSQGTTSVIGTVYREFASENRPEGVSAVLRLLQPF